METQDATKTALLHQGRVDENAADTSLMQKDLNEDQEASHADSSALVWLGGAAGVMALMLLLLYRQTETSDESDMAPSTNTSAAPPSSYQLGQVVSGIVSVLMPVPYLLSLAFLRSRCGPYWFTGRPPYELDEAHQAGAVYDQAEFQPAQMKAGWRSTLLSILQLGAQLHQTTVMPARQRAGLQPSSSLSSSELQTSPARPMAGSFTTDLPASPAWLQDDEELQEALRIIASIEIPDLSAYVAELIASSQHVLKKRDVSRSESVNASLADMVNKIMLNNRKMPATMHQEMAAAFQLVEMATAQYKDLPPSVLSQFTLLTCIKIIARTLNSYVYQGRSYRGSYHYFSLALQQLWDLADQCIPQQILTAFKNDSSAQLTADLRKRLLGIPKDENVRNHLGNQDDQATADYIRLKFPQRSKLPINGLERVFFHPDAGSHNATIVEMLNSEQFNFLCDDTSFCHFLFDNTGLPDAELIEFVQSLRYQEFRDFKAVHFEQEANRMLEQQLKEQTTTPLYFQRATEIKEIIDTLWPDENTTVPAREIIQPLIALASDKQQADTLTRISLDSADVILQDIDPEYFDGMDRDRVLLADYIYTYTDEHGKPRRDTASLPEMMNQASPGLSIDIVRRNNVAMLWPAEFSTALEAVLQKQIAVMKTAAEKFALEMQVQQARADFMRHIPSLESLLEGALTGICKSLGIVPCTLSESITFEYNYKTVAIPPAIQSAPLTLIFTIREILTGRQRAWESEKYLRIPRIISLGDRLLTTNAVKFVQRLQAFDTQGHVMSVLSAVKENKDIRFLYFDYLSKLLLQVPGPLTWCYAFSATPLLVVYFSKEVVLPHITRNRGSSRARIASRNLSHRKTPLLMQSLLSGLIHRFESYEQMLTQIDSDDAVSKHVKAHFDIDLTGTAELQLIKKKNLAESYEEFIEYHLRNADKVIRSHYEANTHMAMQIVFDFSLFLSIAALGFGPGTATMVGVASSVGAKLVQAAISDTQEQFDALLEEAKIAALFEIGMFSIGRSARAGSGIAINYLTRKQAKRLAMQNNLLSASGSGLHNTNVALRPDQRSGAGLAPGNEIRRDFSKDLASFEDVVNRHSSEFNIKFHQNDDLLIPASKLVTPSAVPSLDEGMCLSLSLSTASQVLHGDMAGTGFLKFLKNMATTSAQTPSALKTAQIKMVKYLDDLQAHQPADFNRIKINRLRQQASAYDKQLLEMQTALASKPDSVLISEVLPIASKMNTLQLQIQQLGENGPAAAWRKFDTFVQQWAGKNGMSSKQLDFGAPNRMPGSTKLSSVLMRELDHGSDKAILISTNDHAMLLFRVDGRYHFFEPNFGVLGFDSLRELSNFFFDLSSLQSYQMLPRATVLTRIAPDAVGQSGLPAKTGLTDLQKILDSS